MGIFIVNILLGNDYLILWLIENDLCLKDVMFVKFILIKIYLIKFKVLKGLKKFYVFKMIFYNYF